jgi:cytochrome c peroxidase
MRALFYLCLALLFPTWAQSETFNVQERAAILDHGPWPPPILKDTTNPVSGDPAAIAFGRALFVDKRLSRAGDIARSSCHRANAAFADGLKVSQARIRLTRNTPSLWNVGFNRWFGWGGASDNLWAASLRSILSPDELAGGPDLFIAALAQYPALADAYAAGLGEAYTETARSSSCAVLLKASRALAAYLEVMVSPRTAFDRFRDALAANTAVGVAAYPDAAKRRLKIFIGRGNCSLCHSGPHFTNGEFEDVVIPYFIGPGKVDRGRYGDLQEFQRSPMKMSGAFSSDRELPRARLTERARLQPKDFGAFRIPSLRQAALTSPSMHNSSLATLRDVVKHYS